MAEKKKDAKFLRGAIAGAALMAGFQFTLLYVVSDYLPRHEIAIEQNGDEPPSVLAARILEEAVSLSERVMNRPVTTEDVPDMINGALRALDPYSGYLREDMTSLITQENRKPDDAPYMVGILGSASPEGYFVRSAIPESPAARSDVTAGDRLVSVDGEDVSTLHGSDALAILKAAAQAGQGKEMALVFERAGERVSISIKPEILPETYVYDMGTVGGVLHVQIHGFYLGVTKDVERVVARALSREEKILGLVIDLRGNTGGLTSEAKSLSELFFPKGTLLYTESGLRIGESEVRTGRKPEFPGLRMAVIIDENSASASEIFASAAQSGGFGAIVGTPSYGKGTIQNVYPFVDGSGSIKITVGEYKSASGETIEGIGVLPDIPVEEAVEVFQDKDPAFDAAVEFVKTN